MAAFGENSVGLSFCRRAAMTDIKWNTTGLAEAGFASDLDENFEIARQAGTLPNHMA
jgi:hypothetical protein